MSLNKLSFFTIAGLVLAVDLITKYLVVSNMALHQVVELPAGFIQLQRVHNYGGAFGMLQHQRPFFVFCAVVSLVCIIYFFDKLKKLGPVIFASSALILGGAAGNLADRLYYGYVVDFLDLRWWPVFNVADIALTVGVCVLVVESFRIETHAGRLAEEGQPQEENSESAASDGADSVSSAASEPASSTESTAEAGEQTVSGGVKV